MKLNELIAFLHSIAPIQFQEEYDNAGLIVGDPLMEIRGVVVCLDALESVVDEAIGLGCNVIVAHHPIIFRGIKKLNGKNYIERTIIKAIKNDIAIFAIHTNLDNVYTNGVNAKICEKIGLRNTSILVPKSNLIHLDKLVGAGMIGHLIEPSSELEFLVHLKDVMELKTLKHTQLFGKDVHIIAVCGGAGGFLLNDAKRAGADVFVTSDYKYHEYFDADEAIIIVDIGHYESEKYTIELLYNLIINNFSTFAAHCTKIVTNPIKYF